MTTSDLGLIFGLLLRYREIHGNPPDRRLHDGELEASRILAHADSADLRDLDDFLESQGLALVIHDGFDLGIPPHPRRNNRIYVLTRRPDGELAPYLDADLVFNALNDGRRLTRVTQRAVWVARLWLTLQWCFYERIDRLPAEVSRYRDALVSAELLAETLQQTMEGLANAGRPDGERGYIWDTLWEEREHWAQHARSFLRAMEQAGMVHPAGNEGEYRQTLAAAVELAALAERDLAYLAASSDPAAIEERTLDLVHGETSRDPRNTDHAGHTTH